MEQQEYVECAYCGADIYGDDVSLVPDVDDNIEWDRLEESHAEGCEWIKTRAHRIEQATQ